MAVTKDITWVTGPELNRPIATGYFTMASADTLSSLIDCGFKPSRVEIIFSVPGTSLDAQAPMTVDAIRGIGFTVTSGSSTVPVTRSFQVPAGLINSAYGNFHSWGMDATQDGGNGWKLDNTALTMLYTHVTFIFHR